ncbi:hypothetical protein TYRP_002837 [Tyrophagus putrescentiae]|nr:hypothetical protein TYRP_002837 [Tyrophagus putrescentiae]
MLITVVLCLAAVSSSSCQRLPKQPPPSKPPPHQQHQHSRSASSENGRFASTWKCLFGALDGGSAAAVAAVAYQHCPALSH